MSTATKSTTMRPTYNAYARKRWGHEAEWISGRGRWALLAFCWVLTIKLYETDEDARKARKSIDETGCCGFCEKNHKIVDLSAFARAPRGSS